MLAGILGVVDSGLDLATSVVQRMNLKDRLKYIERVRVLKLAFIEENGKPDGIRIDSKCEKIRDDLFVEMQTMNAAISAGVLEGAKE